MVTSGFPVCICNGGSLNSTRRFNCPFLSAAGVEDHGFWFDLWRKETQDPPPVDRNQRRFTLLIEEQQSVLLKHERLKSARVASSHIFVTNKKGAGEKLEAPWAVTATTVE